GRFHLAGGGKLQAHPGAALGREFLGRITQFDDAAMLLDNAPDDGETKAGALLARRDVRLGQPAAVFFRQADAVVDDVDVDVFAVAAGEDVDRALAEFGRRHR